MVCRPAGLSELLLTSLYFASRIMYLLIPEPVSQKVLKAVWTVFWVLLAGSNCLSAAAAGVQGGPKELVLSQNSHSGYVIVVPRKATATELFAARELAYFLKQIGGANLQIKDDSVAPPARALLIGNTSALQRIKVLPEWSKLDEEGFSVSTRNQQIIIAGRTPRATLYGVYELLERLGCRWFTPEVSKIPRLKRIALTPFSAWQQPAFEYREVFTTESFNADWSARNRLNGSAPANANLHPLGEKHGGKFEIVPFVHSFYQLIPPQEYFEKHPEYFSLIDGKRQHLNGQLCLTNAGLLQLMIEKVEGVIRDNPGIDAVSVSQNDGGINCQCRQCKAIDDREGSPSGSLLAFVNAVADAIKLKHPTISIDTLAYTYTRKPPKTIRPRANVIIRLCSIECDFTQPFATGPRNKEFMEDLRAWGAICNRIYIWDYHNSFTHYLLPFPNLHNLASNVRVLAANGAKGYFAQGAYAPGGGGENTELRGYLLARLLWNPATNTAQDQRDFLTGVYGPAAATIEEYLRLLQENAVRSGAPTYWTHSPDSPMFTRAFLDKAQSLFDKAEVLAGADKTLLLRVRKARLPIDYVTVLHDRKATAGFASRWRFDAASLAQEIPVTATKTRERFFTTARAAGITLLNENNDKVAALENDIEASSRIKLRWEGERGLQFALSPENNLKLFALRKEEPQVNSVTAGIPEGSDLLRYSTKGGSLVPSPAYEERYFGQGSGDATFVESKNGKGYEAELSNGLQIMRMVQTQGDSLLLKTTVRNSKAVQPVRASARYVLNLRGPLVVSGAFGEKGFGAERSSEFKPEYLKISPAEMAVTPVTIRSQNGATLSLQAAGPLAGLTLTSGPEGLPVITLAYEVTTLPPDQAVEWNTALKFSGFTTAVVQPQNSAGSYEAQDASFDLFNEGSVTWRQFDPTASDAVSTVIDATKNEWAVQWRYPVALFQPGVKYRVVAVVRIVGSGKDLSKSNKPTLQCGIYNVDQRARKQQNQLNDITPAGEWQTITLDGVTPEASDYIWFAAADNADVIQIQIDRILMIPMSTN